LKLVTDACVPGAKVLELCQLGDNKIIEETSALFKKGKDGVKIEKGSKLFLLYFILLK